jgi:hypothetical protein
MGAVSRPENGWACGPWGFESLSFRFGGMAAASACPVPAWSSWEDTRPLTARAQVRALPPEPLRALVIEEVMTPGGRGPIRKLPIRVLPRVLRINDPLVDLAVRGGLRSREGEGEEVDPGRPPASASIAGEVTSDLIWLWGSWSPHRPWKPGIAGSSPASQTLRGRGAVVLASLMSSRPWVRIPPARLSRGRSSDGQSARLSSERPPVRARPSPLWPWCRRRTHPAHP